MCSINCILFGARNLGSDEITGKKTLEIGSCDVNGSLRPFVESRKPAEYIGIGIVPGPGVDIICDAENLLDKFELASFDLVISTELLEHVRNWRKVISNIKKVCKLGGIILLTTRSIGFPFHGYPHDFWRYELNDMKNIFSDCSIQVLGKGPADDKGVYIKAKKTCELEQKDLSDYELYSIVADKRVKEITDKDLRSWHFRKRVAKTNAKHAALKVAGKLYKLL